MRAAFVGFVMLLAGLVCVAQDIPVASEQAVGGVVIAPTATPKEFHVSPLPLVTEQAPQQRKFEIRPYNYRIQPGATAGQGTCYTMRAYLFSPGTPGSAPRRTGYTTCVPSNALQMRETRQPKARLLPQ